MFQTRLSSVNDKILRRFYEPLILLSVLDPARGAQYPDLITDRGIDGSSKLWRNFLDRLSWLCDSNTGGDTVTSIAAQKTLDRPCFWVASNSKSRYRAQGLLIWLFDRLTRINQADSDTVARIQAEIFTHCIDFSAKRVRAYTIWLLELVNEAQSATREVLTHDDDILLGGLHELTRLAVDPHTLCGYTHDIRNSDFMRVLSKRHNADSSHGVWSKLRHYIGRLGCWQKAVRIICEGAQRFPQFIANAHVEVVEPDERVDRPNEAHLSNLEGLVRRMLPAHELNSATELCQALKDVDSITDVETQFREAYSSVRPRPHAELLILEHFDRNHLEFVNDEKYIGCSKPSCYCCHLYMQLHKGNFTPRPCHGNLWANWAPPIPLPPVEPKRKATPRVQEHHTFQMMQKMVPRIRADLQAQILSRRPKRVKLPDSTTGMSSVVFASKSEKFYGQGLASDIGSDDLTDSASNSLTIMPQTQYVTEGSEDSAIDGSDSSKSVLKRSQSQRLDRVSEHKDDTPDTADGEVPGETLQRQLEIEEDEDVLLFRGRRFM